MAKSIQGSLNWSQLHRDGPELRSLELVAGNHDQMLLCLQRIVTWLWLGHPGSLAQQNLTSSGNITIPDRTSCVHLWTSSQAAHHIPWRDPVPWASNSSYRKRWCQHHSITCCFFWILEYVFQKKNRRFWERLERVASRKNVAISSIPNRNFLTHHV